jgi:hypothetical protein
MQDAINLDRNPDASCSLQRYTKSTTYTDSFVWASDRVDAALLGRESFSCSAAHGASAFAASGRLRSLGDEPEL